MARLTDEIRAFLDERRFAVLATSNPDGTIQQSVMWYLREGDTIVMNTAKGRVKFRNMSESSAVSLCIEDGYRFVTLTGNVALNDDQGIAKVDIQRIGRRYSSGEDVARMYESQWRSEQRVTLTMPITRVVANGFQAGE